MNSKTITKAFKGKVIKEIALNAAWDNVRKSYYYNPQIIFTDGTLMGFFVQETEVGEYGVKPVSHVLDDVALPVCGSCQKTLTIHDPIAETDDQSLLCFKCEQLERCDACEHFHEVNETCGKCGKTWSGDTRPEDERNASLVAALQERFRLDPDAPSAIVIASDQEGK